MMLYDFTVAIFASYCLNNVVNKSKWLTTSNTQILRTSVDKGGVATH